MIRPNNLYDNTSTDENSEIFTPLFQNGSIKIESIRSWLKTAGEVYDQDQDEWVIVLEGEAVLEIDNQMLNLQRGDYLFIPKHTRHRVCSTAQNTLWLGVFSS